MNKVVIILISIFIVKITAQTPDRRYLPPPPLGSLPTYPPAPVYGAPGTQQPGIPPAEQDPESIVIDAPPFNSYNLKKATMYSNGYPRVSQVKPPFLYGPPGIPSQEDPESVIIDAPPFRKGNSRRISSGGNVYQGGAHIGRIKDGPLSASVKPDWSLSLTYFPGSSYSTTDAPNRSRDQNYATTTSQHTPSVQGVASSYFNNTGSFPDRTGSTPYQSQTKNARYNGISKVNTVASNVNIHNTQGSSQGRNNYNNSNGPQRNPVVSSVNSFVADSNLNSQRTDNSYDSQKAQVVKIPFNNHDEGKEFSNIVQHVQPDVCGSVVIK